jgi:hypothetical protein
VLTAVDLGELAETRAPMAGLVRAAGSLRARHPETCLDHPLAQGLTGDRDAVLLRELLTRERRPEVGVVLTNEGHGLLANGRGPLPIAGPPALARDEPSRAVLAQDAAKALDLAQAEAELLGGLSLRQATFDHAAEDLEPVEFLRAHR